MDDKTLQYWSVGEAKRYLFQNYEEGLKCPCCDQFVRLYKRKITSSMAYELILIYKAKTDDYISIPEYFSSIVANISGKGVLVRSGGDYAKLVYWGLLEKKTGERDDGSKRTGYYCITELGKAFVRGEVKVPKNIYLYNNELRGTGGEDISIKEALKDKFNYTELMGYELTTKQMTLNVVV